MLSLDTIRPSAVTVLAVGAVVVALSGAAVALPAGGGSITSKDIKNGQVKKPDIARNAVTGKAVKESTLSTVPSAASVDGVVIVPVRYRALNSVDQTYFSARGLTLRVTCEGGDLAGLDAITTKQNSSMYVVADDTEDANDPPGNDLESGSFDPGGSLNMNAGATDHNQLDPAILTFEYDAPDGTIITRTLATDEDTDDHSDCGITGHILVS